MQSQLKSSILRGLSVVRHVLGNLVHLTQLQGIATCTGHYSTTNKGAGVIILIMVCQQHVELRDTEYSY